MAGQTGGVAMGAPAIRSRALACALALGGSAWLGAGPAQAQFFGGRGGMGFGFGYGLGGYTPASVNLIDRHALQMTSIAAAEKPQPLHAAVQSGPRNNAPRLPEFGERYGVESRRLYLEDRYSLGQSGGVSAGARPASPGLAPASGPARPRFPLTSFFNGERQLVWPSDAPVDGDLKSMRDAADVAAAGVLKETAGGGVATVASVTDARSALLNYGRPALRQVRSADPGGVGDAFDGFLMSLYDALGRAASQQVALNR